MSSECFDPKAAPDTSVPRGGTTRAPNCHRGGANDIKAGNSCSVPPERAGSGGSRLPRSPLTHLLWAQLCTRSSHGFQGEKRCSSQGTKCTAHFVLLLVGDRYFLIAATPLAGQGAEDALDPISLPAPLPTKLWYCREKKWGKKKIKIIRCST